MRTASTDLLAHLAQKGAAAIALCAEARWADGASTALRFTSWDRDLVITETGGDEPIDVVYYAGLGMSVSKVQGNSDGKVDHLEARLLINGAVISQDEITAGRWRGATLRLFLVNPEDLTMGQMDFHSGTLGQTTLERGVVVAEFLGLLQRYLSTLGEVVTATCQNVFCGAVDARGRGCGLDEATYTHTGEVTSYDPDATIGGQAAIIVGSDDLDAFPDDTFLDGRIRFDDQPWIWIGIRLSRETGGGVVLKQEPPFAITVGMAFTIIEGCAKTLQACKDHSNVARMRAFPYLKGNDKLFQTGKR